MDSAQCWHRLGGHLHHVPCGAAVPEERGPREAGHPRRSHSQHIGQRCTTPPSGTKSMSPQPRLRLTPSPGRWRWSGGRTTASVCLALCVCALTKRSLPRGCLLLISLSGRVLLLHLAAAYINGATLPVYSGSHVSRPRRIPKEAVRSFTRVVEQRSRGERRPGSSPSAAVSKL